MPFFAEYDSTAPSPAQVVGWYHTFHEKDDPGGMPYPNLPAQDRLLQLTPDEWTAHIPTASNWAVDNGKLIPYVRQPTAAQLKASRVLNAKAALADTLNRVVLRCFEEDVPLPADWKAYRAALRAIVAGGDGELPAEPAMPTFPSGS